MKFGRIIEVDMALPAAELTAVVKKYRRRR
jgi:hypothetical protein